MAIILIVEDDPINAQVFAKVLKKRGGLDSRHTEDVEEVIRAAQDQEIHLILMDVSLSRSYYQGKPIDGIGITQILKADPTTANVPVILVTAHAMRGDREHLLQQSGADDYISKPVVDHEGFVQQVKALLPPE